MIFELTNFSNTTVLPQGHQKEINSFQSIRYSSEQRGSGGFGKVFPVVDVDGAPRPDLLVKIFSKRDAEQHALRAIELLHQKLKKRQQNSRVSTFHEFPGLIGLPFLGFKAHQSITNTDVVAFVMFDLKSLGYIEYEQHDQESKEFLELEVEDKILLAFQLAHTIAFLRKLNFVYADISERNLWVKPSKPQISLIDFDSGFHIDSQQNATTIGTIGHWTGRLFRKLISREGKLDKVTATDRIAEDNWVLANAIFQLIFGTTPYFFLKDAETETKTQYLQENQWPSANYPSDLINPANTEAHEHLHQSLENLLNSELRGLIGLMVKAFNTGFEDGEKRPSPAEWKSSLFEIVAKIDSEPVISSFSSDTQTITRKGQQVKFRFEGERFDYARINRHAVNLNENELLLALDDESVVQLSLHNEFGTATADIQVTAIKEDPVIDFFVASEDLIKEPTDITLRWNVQKADYVKISSISKQFPTQGETTISPKQPTTITLTAFGAFDQEVQTSLEIKTVLPEIEFLRYEVNLEHGLENVDVSWKVSNATHVEISPIGPVKTEGLHHLSLLKPTELNLHAKGHFGSVKKSLIAHPFPIPIIETLLTPTPPIEVNLEIPIQAIKIPNNVIDSLRFSKLDLSAATQLPSSLQMQPEISLPETAPPPEFEISNELLERVKNAPPSFRDLFDAFKSILHNKLKKYEQAQHPKTDR